jgi:signal transduction histidine kinase
MFGLNEPCKSCPIKNGHEDRETMGREVKLSEQAYTVHSSRVKNLSNNFYLHIYETEENSQKRESIKIQRGKLQSLGLVTQALTHELNNPLTGILELSQDLETEFEGQTAEDLREINLASKRCIDIIENLKNFSSRKIRFSRVNFSGAIKSALVLTKVLTRNTNVQMDLDEEIWISGSKTLLSQIIFNIIKNSVEASGKGGEIKLSLKRTQDNFAVLVLEDNGPGLPAGMNEVTLFGTQNKEKGTGYGLFLVNEFVKLHKGKLSFGNLPGGGAYFKIVIPMT